MEYIIGIVLAVGIGLMASIVGFGRERGFYTTVTMVVASYYALFAVLGGSHRALWMELIGVLVFVALAIYGYKRSLWIVALALFGHGVFDIFHGDLISNPGVPKWWPMFCMAYDVAAAAYLAVALRWKKW